MGRKKSRRQSHGSAWHWKQTDAWYYTLPGAKKRVPLFDEEGQRIRGKDAKKAADVALARVKVAGNWETAAPPATPQEWLVARVCSEYLLYCQRGAANGTLSQAHCENASWLLNDFCAHCGALAAGELKKVHVKDWLESHKGWRSTITHRNAITIVLAAFNRAQEDHGVPNPIKGLKKPSSKPRLQSLSVEDEQAILAATNGPFRDFLFAAIHSGLRPFCELARLTAEMVIDTDRGMMWRVYSSKTQKTRKVPVLPAVAELTRQNLANAPAGSGIPLFPNTEGNPWLRCAGVLSFVKIKRKLGWDKDPLKARFSCYTCRHTFVHRMLSGHWNNGKGCSIEVLAELIGDTPKVAFDHYGKEWGQHYQEPLWAAVGLAAPPVALPPEQPRPTKTTKRKVTVRK